MTRRVPKNSIFPALGFYIPLQMQAQRLWEEPQHADRSQCSREDSPCLPTSACPLSSREKGCHQARESLQGWCGPSGLTLPPAGQAGCCQAARLPAGAKPFGGT